MTFLSILTKILLEEIGGIIFLPVLPVGVLVQKSGHLVLKLVSAA